MADSARMFEPADIARATALLTRLPLGGDGERRGACAWAYPLAGLAVALIAGLGAWIVLCLGLPALPAAGIALALGALVTGALHEDGLADTADGFWGGADPARRLEIMRDSRIGTYGVVALLLGFGLRWSALAMLFAEGAVFAPLIAAAVLSRAVLPGMLRLLPPARRDGLGAAQGVPPREAVLAGAGIAIVLALLTAGFCGAIVGTALAIAVAAIAGMAARARIGGHTGDVLGATQQAAEIAVLCTLAAIV